VSKRASSTPLSAALTEDLRQAEKIANAELANAEAKAWAFTKSELAIQNHLSMRDSDYRGLVARHHEQDDKIEKLTYDLGITQSSGTWATLIGVFSGLISALIPVISLFVPWLKTIVSVETFGITGGVIAGALLPMAVWLSNRRRKYFK
jgi:hypothetical protein